MKKFLSILFLLTGLSVVGQNLVVTTPQHRNIVLEQFTGIHCGVCPEGHDAAEILNALFFNQVVQINIHSGVFSSANPSEPDFNTVIGDSINSWMGAPESGYPCATVNRTVFPQYGNNPAISRNHWKNAADIIYGTPSPINVGFTAQTDSLTRLLTVNTELFYLEGISDSSYLHIALLESFVEDYQYVSGVGVDTAYQHNHILRQMITGLQGFALDPAASNSVQTNEFSFSIPTNYNIENCEVAVYVSDTDFNVYTGFKANAKNGIHDGNAGIYLGEIISTNTEVFQGYPNQDLVIPVSFVSHIPGIEYFELSLNSPQDLPDWESSLAVNSISYQQSVQQPIQKNIPINIDLQIKPGSTAAVANYKLEIKSLSFPDNPPLIYDLHIFNNLTDLIVEGSGTWGDNGMYDFQRDFTAGLEHAGNTNFDVIDGQLMAKAHDQQLLANINNIFYNVGWRFPSFQESEASALIEFLDGGGNLFVSGQDIGYEIIQANGNPQSQSVVLYEHYLHVKYLDDGYPGLDYLTPVTTDPHFGDMPDIPLIDIFNGNMFPEIVSPRIGAEAFLSHDHNEVAKAGIRFHNGGFKSVYLGVDLAMVADSLTRLDIIKRSHDWFYNPLAVSTVTDVKIKVYPNPCSNTLYVDHVEEGVLYLYNNLGALVHEQIVRKNQSTTIHVGQFSKGLYTLHFKSKNGFSSELISIK